MQFKVEIKEEKDMPNFLVHPSFNADPEETFVIFASNESDARSKALNLYSKHDLFREYVESFYVNDGFVELFCEDDKGYLYNDDDEDTFSYREDLYTRFAQDEKKILAYIDEIVIGNVRSFFQDRSGLAEIYLNEYNKKELTASGFPEDMYCYILEKTEFSYFGRIIVSPIKIKESHSL
jgi:hypothetical protein